MERGLQVSRLSFWNFSYAPKQIKDVPHPQTLPSRCLPAFPSTAQPLAQLEQSWGCSCLCRPEQPPGPTWLEQGPGAHTGCSAAAPHQQLTALLFVRHSSTNWKSPQDPLQQFTGFSVLPEVRKAAARERRGQSQYTLLYPQDSSAPKVPSNKGHKLHDGKVGTMALGHSARPLPVSPA